MADGFLGRWARRKEAVRQGREVPPEPQVEAAPVAAPPQHLPAAPASESVSPAGSPAAEAPSPPTLEEVRSLTSESDFSRFIRPDVAPEVKNAAMKKLFSDPHFNVMDRLDTYIDDYSLPDPIPHAMLRQLASAKFLNLFREEEEQEERERLASEAKTPSVREGADGLAAGSVAQSGTRTAQALPPAEHHADPDLRLQQDHAPGPEEPGAGSG